VRAILTDNQAVTASPDHAPPGLDPDSGRAWSLAALLLALATSLLYAAYTGPRLVSGNIDRDALAYLATIADACAQARVGSFPVYVGQSQWRFDGGLYPQAQAPYLTLVAPLLDLLTLRRLTSPHLFNLLALTHVLGGALVSLLVLRRVAPRHPWAMACLSWAYVACPGVMGVLVRLDMLNTILTLPLLPLLWDALARLCTGPREHPGWRPGVQLGLSLAGLWSAHAPVALWASSSALVAGLVGLALARRWRDTGRGLVVALGVFALVAAWPLLTVFTLTEGRAGQVGVGAPNGRLAPELVARTLAHLRGDALGSWLPLGFVRGHPSNGWPYPDEAVRALPSGWRERAVLPYLQLGWLLWAALLGSALRLRHAHAHAQAALLAAALGLVLFLYPLPGLGEWLWGALPGLFDITRIWPMQRFYVLLASLAVACGARAWASLPSQPRSYRFARVLLGVLVVWSASQAARLGSFAWQQRAPDDGLERPENVPLRLKDLQMGSPHPLPEWSDARLHLALLDERGQPVTEALAVAAAGCAEARPLETLPGDDTVAVLTLTADHPRLICLSAAPAGLLEVYGTGYYRQRRTPAGATQALPLWTSAGAGQRVAVRFGTPDGHFRPLRAPTFLLGGYAPAVLPVVVERWLPLRLWVPAARAGQRLETPRRFMPDQTALVNGRPVAAERSARGLLALALQPGSNRVELSFRAPRRLRWAWPASMAALLLACAALAFGRISKRKPGSA
jgi:hypothetical protein